MEGLLTNLLTGAFLTVLVLTPTVAGVIQVQPTAAVFEGTVVDAVTGQRVAGARVGIAAGTKVPPPSATRPERTATPTPQRGVFSVTTDSLGRFAFRDFAPGPHTLAVAADGYVALIYGQKSWLGMAMPLNLTATVNPSLVVRLNPEAHLSGTVLNEDQRAASGVTVFALRPAFSSDGNRSYGIEKEVLTDDAGRYNLTGLPPGRFHLVAGFARTSPPLRSAENLPPYGWTYYPGVSQTGLAAHIDIKAGARVDLGALVLSRQEPRKVSGRIVDSRTGKPPEEVNVSLVARLPFGGGRVNDPRFGKYDPATGTFEFSNVPHGIYRIDASVPQPTPSAETLDDYALRMLNNTYRSAPFDAFAVVEVSSTDVNDIVLTVPGPGLLRGRIVVNGQDSISGLNLEAFYLAATEALQPVVSRMPVNSADGTFEVRASLAGIYRFNIIRLPENFYIRDARLDGVRILNGLLDLPKDAVSNLAITLSPDGGQIDGTVVNARSEPVPVVVGIVLPDPLPETIGIYHSLWVGGDGKFTLHGIAPGNYRIYVWDGLGEESHFDRELLLRSRIHATPIRIDPRSRISPTVKIIVP